MNVPLEVCGAQNSSHTIGGHPLYCHSCPLGNRTRILSLSSSYAIAITRDESVQSIHSITTALLSMVHVELRQLAIGVATPGASGGCLRHPSMVGSEALGSGCG